MLSSLLLVAVTEPLACGHKEELPWDLLYAYDLVLLAESMEDLNDKVVRWNECMETKWLKINISKNKGDGFREGIW